MATLVLTVVGSAIGGPIGGAIGAAIGQTIDRDLLFKPKGRQGPRLTELAIQTSSYGRQIPKVFGSMRVAGSVIWATDLIEHRQTQRGGKGQPSVTNYSYSASFAVALSARPILDVGRIWAEGSLLRGAAGDWKATTGFRLHRGGEDQAADPLIASAEGAALAPAHRGIAYAVFENLALADFGNRIPSLTFEVIADPGAVAIGGIARELGDGTIVGDGPVLPIDGFTAYGDGMRAVIETLGDAAGAWFASVGDGIELHAEAGGVVTIEDAGATGARRTRSIKPIETVPRIVALSHYDPARDWQAGVQRATRPGAGTRTIEIEAPMAISAAAAKTMAEAMLARAETARATRRVIADSAAIGVAPGDILSIMGEGGQWRVTQASIERLTVTLDLVPATPAILTASASGGRVLAAPDEAAGTTVIHAFETPALDEALLTRPRLTIVAAGSAPGWRRAALLYSLDDGVTWIAGGGTAAPGIVGAVTLAPTAGPATIEDRTNAIEIELAHDGMVLASASADAIDRGANLALVGDELIQFRSATQIAPRRWLLTALLRGRRGMAGTHAIGERFVLIEDDSSVTLELPVTTGASVRVMASGTGDGDMPADVTALLSGVSIVPPAPVALTAADVADGGAAVRWRRRGRTGWRWRDGTDMPLGEEREAYSVDIDSGIGTRTIETGVPTVLVNAAERAAGAVTVTVRQIGTNGLSHATSITV